MELEQRSSRDEISRLRNTTSDGQDWLFESWSVLQITEERTDLCALIVTNYPCCTSRLVRPTTHEQIARGNQTLHFAFALCEIVGHTPCALFRRTSKASVIRFTPVPQLITNVRARMPVLSLSLTRSIIIMPVFYTFVNLR